MLCLNQGLALVDAQGAGVYPMDSPLVSFERPGLYRYSADFMPEKPRTYINLFNNTWSTNFRDWIGGTWTSHVRVWAFDRYHARLVRHYQWCPTVSSRHPRSHFRQPAS